MPKDIFKIHKVDARKINSLITIPIVDVTVTSPPYFDMKDYGYPEQIGYGQEYEQYLEDLYVVFSNVFHCTKDTGTLWVIIDAFRKNGETVPLPFDFANKIKGIGWKLQEIIIWGKDKTVPWAHKGQMRNSFEYILMFSKSDTYNFYLDKVRDYEALKKWWIKYPERYNPRGKTPEAIWHFDIPVQGSWGNGYIRHFCPLPEEMIAQILKLTTLEGDVVLDPFSGTGAVLSKADNMKRKYIGTELNSEYIQMFENYLTLTGKDKRSEYELGERNTLHQNSFEKLILELRSLKFARLFYQKLQELGVDNISLIFVEVTKLVPQRVHSIVVVKYSLLVRDSNKVDEMNRVLAGIVEKAPLSKFGIESQFTFSASFNEFAADLHDKKLFLYTNKVTHHFKRRISVYDISELTRSDIIVSEISVSLNEKDYE